MKQYNKAKPVKWGFKVFALCASDSGFIHHFYLNTGRSNFDIGDTEVETYEDLPILDTTLVENSRFGSDPD